jgi:hypothetical protein
MKPRIPPVSEISEVSDPDYSIKSLLLLSFPSFHHSRQRRRARERR